MNDLDIQLKNWTEATAKLEPGIQRVFHDVFVLASDGKTHLVYGADYVNGYPCLVNSVGSMLTVGGGQGIPSANFGEIVGLFDSINYSLQSKGVNASDHLVSPLAADVFLQNFAALKEINTEPAESIDPVDNQPYFEPSDATMAKWLVEAMQTEAPVEEIQAVHNDLTPRESFEGAVVKRSNASS